MPDSKSTPAISQVVTSASGLVSEPRPKKLLDQVRDAIKRKHYSPRTEESYVDWIRRFILSQQPKQSDLEHECLAAGTATAES